MWNYNMSEAPRGSMEDGGKFYIFTPDNIYVVNHNGTIVLPIQWQPDKDLVDVSTFKENGRWEHLNHSAQTVDFTPVAWMPNEFDIRKVPPSSEVL